MADKQKAVVVKVEPDIHHQLKQWALDKGEPVQRTVNELLAKCLKARAERRCDRNLSGTMEAPSMATEGRVNRLPPTLKRTPPALPG